MKTSSVSPRELRLGKLRWWEDEDSNKGEEWAEEGLGWQRG